MQRMLETVRQATLPGVWSQGVKLVRDGAVTRVPASSCGRGSGTANEVVLRVRAPGHAIAPTVTLYPRDGEWTCDCAGKVDPCPHVAAAAIFAAQAPAPDAASPSEEPAPGARLVYRLGREATLLTLSRVIVRADGSEEPVTSLASEVAQGRAGELSATHDDLRIDRILGPSPRRFAPLARIGDLFEAMAASEVTLDGRPVKVSGQTVLPRASVVDAPGGFLLRIDRDPAITDVIAKAVARVGDTLRPLGETTTTGDLLERLPLERTFRSSDEAELVTRVIPELEKRLEVTIATTRLPRKSVTARPRIAMDLSHQGHTLSILPTLVYGDPPIARVDGEALAPLGRDVPVRRRDEERALIARLRDELNLVPGRRVDLDGVEAIRFAKKLRDFQHATGQGSQVFEGKPLVARVVFAGGAFDVVFEHEEVSGQPVRRADAGTVLRAWRDGLDLVPLEGGGWAPLPVDWLARHGDRVADLLAARDPDKKLARSALPELGTLCDELDAPRPMELGQLAPLLEGFEGIPRAHLPDGLHATLRAYQERGVDWLSFLRDAELGAVLADDMGLGKTLQTIAVLRGRALVVCPKSVLHNWAGEIARFRPRLRVALFHGPSRALDPRADVTLTTYSVLRLDTTLLATETWDAVVLDEAQAIKNESSQTARAAFELRGRFRVALSGTPVENRLEELWSIMHFVNPGLLGGRSDFRERYAAPIAVGDPGAAARLRAKIRPFVLRRMKRDVLPELPPRTDQVLAVELDERERAVYDAVRVATRKDVAEKLQKGGGAGVLAALEALLRLRQASCHSALVPGQSAETSSKIEAVVEALSDAAADGHKALVFSQWTSLLDLVEPHLTQEGIAFTRLDGSTTDRAGVVAAFQDEAGPPVMLVSLKAGGTGLNLTAADHVFLLDPWWNPAVEDQAADRAHRIGQDRPVMVYRLVAKDTVEERILLLQERKRAIADVALGEAGQAGGITRDELLALLD
jgi:superfamily II DNA or RNA helicase